MNDKDKELKELLDKRITKTKLFSFDETRELVNQARQETFNEVEKMIDEIDFYELREQIRLYCFDDDKDYVSYFRKWFKQELQKLQEKEK